MTHIQVGNAPCSWGTLEFEGLAGERIGYAQMLAELVETGYTGTELGDWGFMPTNPAALRAEMDRRRLTMLGAYVGVALKNPAAHTPGEANVLKVAHLLAEATRGQARPPFLVLADENNLDPVRSKHAGRITPELGLSEAEWRTFAQGAERIARAVREETGLRAVFHHHCAGYVETPDEIARLLGLTDPELLGLVFDTGHYLYGSGTNDPEAVLAGLDRFAGRIWYVHFKDCHPVIAARARAEGWDYLTTVGRGVFCELGQGGVNFPAVLDWLRRRHYQDWVLVEQDVLPGLGSPKQSAGRNRAYLRSIGL